MREDDLWEREVWENVEDDEQQRDVADLQQTEEKQTAADGGQSVARSGQSKSSDHLDREDGEEGERSPGVARQPDTPSADDTDEIISCIRNEESRKENVKEKK